MSYMPIIVSTFLKLVCYTRVGAIFERSKIALNVQNLLRHLKFFIALAHLKMQKKEICSGSINRQIYLFSSIVKISCLFFHSFHAFISRKTFVYRCILKSITQVSNVFNDQSKKIKMYTHSRELRLFSWDTLSTLCMYFTSFF